MENSYRIDVSTSPPKDYIEALNLKPSSFYLLPEYGEIFDKLNIGENIYFTIFDKSTPIASLQLQKAIIGGTLITFLPKFILKFLRNIKFLNTITGHMQPLIISNNLNNLNDYFFRILEYVESYCDKNGLNIQIDLIAFSDEECLKNFVNKYRKICATARINLKEKEESIFEKFPKSIKNTLKKEYGTVLKEVDYKTYYKHLSKNWKDKKISVNNEKYYKILASIPGNKVKYFLIFSSNNKVLSGSAVGFGNKTMIEFSMFSTIECKNEKIPGGDLLKWELIKKGVKNKFEYLDLNMIEVDPNMSKKSEDINFFKTKWGVEKVYGVKIEKFNNTLDFIRKLKISFLGK